VRDGLLVRTDPDAAGVRVGADGSVTALWIAASVPADPGAGSGTVGRHIADLLADVADRAGRRARVSRRNVRRLTLESVGVSLHSIARQTGGSDLDWPTDLMDAVAASWGLDVDQQWLTCDVDAGDVVRMPRRTVCCVLSSTHANSACPGCPLLGSTAAQAEDTAAWISGLDDDAFNEVVGRRRITR
jgi:hypothetical protein